MSSDYHDSNQRMLEALGLSTLLMMSLFAAAFSASGVLAREIEDKTALTVISKPVSRATFVMGKYFGVAGAILVFYYLGSLVYMMTVRHKVMPATFDRADWPVLILGFSALILSIVTAVVGNLTFNWTFTSSAVMAATVLMSIAMGLIAFIGKGWQIVPFGYGLSPDLLVAMGILFMAVLVFVAVAITASTRAGQTVTLLICLVAFAIGSSHSELFARLNRRLVLSQPIGWLCPDLGLFYCLDALAQGRKVPLSLMTAAAGYCTLVTAGILALGAALFQQRQLENQGTSASMPGLVSMLAWIGRACGVVVALAGIEMIVSLVVTNEGFINTVSRILPATAGEAWRGWALGFKPALLGVFSLAGDGATGALAAAGIVAGAGIYLLWGFFARGSVWTRWTVMALALAGLIASVVAAVTRLDKARVGMDTTLAATSMGLASLLVLAVLWLPKTRHHFR